MSRLFVCICVRDDPGIVPGTAEKLQPLGQTLAQIAGGHGEGRPLQRTAHKRETAAQRGRSCVGPGFRLRHKLRVAISVDCRKLCHHRRNHRINLVRFHCLCEHIAVTLLVLQSVDRVRILVDRFRGCHFIKNGLVKRMQEFGVGDGSSQTGKARQDAWRSTSSGRPWFGHVSAVAVESNRTRAQRRDLRSRRQPI